MARTAAIEPQAPDPTTINLTRILSHLERALLSADADPKLRRSEYERARVGANLEYARSLLLRLEHDSTSIKIQSRKQAIQTDLQTKRELIKQLNQRLTELNQLDDSEEEDEASEEDDATHDENYPSYAPAVRTASSGIDTVYGVNDTPELRQAATNLTSTLRARNTKTSAPSQDKGTTTSSSILPPNSTSEKGPSATDMESHNHDEHEAIADSLVAMARALKASAAQFGATLDGTDKEILEKVTGALDKNQLGLESASRRMGALTRMTEGKGWFGRLSLWAKLGVLWFVAIFIVFATPKLRF